MINQLEGPRSLLIEMRTKNGRLYRAIFERYPSVLKFCQAHGITYPSVLNLINLRAPAYMKSKPGTLTAAARRICRAIPDEHEVWLFDPELYDNTKIPSETLVVEIDPHDMLSLEAAAELPSLMPGPDELLDPTIGDVIRHTLATLTPREETVIQMRFGLEPYARAHTYEEIGEKFNVIRERIRQIEGKAIRKLRHPLRGRRLLRASQGFDTTPEQEAAHFQDEAAMLAEEQRHDQRQRFERATQRRAERHRQRMIERRQSERFYSDWPDNLDQSTDEYVTELLEETPAEIIVTELVDDVGHDLSVLAHDHYRPVSRDGVLRTQAEMRAELARRRELRELGINPALPQNEIETQLRKLKEVHDDA